MSGAKFAAAVDAAAEKAPEVREALNQGKKLSPGKLKEIAEAETKTKAKELAKAAIEGYDEKQEEEPPKKTAKDALGRVVTDPRYVPVFLDVEEFHATLREMKSLEAKVKRLAGNIGGSRLDMADFCAFKGMKAALNHHTPHSICKLCHGVRIVMESGSGKKVDCPTCLGLGWVDHFTFERVNSRE
jgi:hypothetical protein